MKKSLMFVIPTLTGGGAERVVMTLVNNLDRANFKVSLLVVDTRQAVFLDQMPSDINFIDLKSSRVLFAIPKIVRWIWRLRPHVLFSTLGHLNLALSMMRGFLPSTVKHIARETTIPSQEHTQYTKPKLWHWMYSKFYPSIDLVICQSNAMRFDLIENFNIPEEKTVVINNPVDIENIRRLSGVGGMAKRDRDCETYLVAAGRLSPEKGFDLLIEAIALLQDESVFLDILGEGAMFEKLQCLIAKHDLISRVRLVGFQKNPYAWYAQADAFIMSSRYEGFPNVLLEALTLGVPVISVPSQGGVLEIIDKIPGCWVSEQLSAYSLAQAISSWQRTDRARIAGNVVDKYALKSILLQYEEVFTGLL